MQPLVPEDIALDSSRALRSLVRAVICIGLDRRPLSAGNGGDAARVAEMRAKAGHLQLVELCDSRREPGCTPQKRG
jgi:hypothetical protein